MDLLTDSSSDFVIDNRQISHMDSTSGLVLAVTVILGIVHGLVLSAVLYVNKKGDRTANRLLSVLILVLV
ncbi:MAG: hypothetical protein IH951_13380 [Bacteroidetes bacterium]|nr:hypothetical protein [Bacteroidota bacterium]